jgi:hypothetical protein
MAAGAQVSQLLGKWAQSFEEDADGGLVFRPFSFSFPPSRRGRTMLNFKPDGALEVGLGPGPDDRTQTGAGRWELVGDRLTIDAPGWSGVFEIETLDQNRLVLRRRP